MSVEWMKMTTEVDLTAKNEMIITKSEFYSLLAKSLLSLMNSSRISPSSRLVSH